MDCLMKDCSGKVIIAGPCALESRLQLQTCVRVLLQMGVTMIRASLWKPRTQPGWDGFGAAALPLLLEETLPHGVVPATEVLCAEHARQVVLALEQFGTGAQIIVWIGSRNQNHIEQRKISKILAACPHGVVLMYKNQMWDDESHWLGIHEHIVAEGFPIKQLMSCHRGFSPGKMDNPKGWRNVPDFEMAMRVKEKTGIPMLFDPSHIGGTRASVVDICTIAGEYNFDGYLIEMHTDPLNAKTDAHQQLSPDQLYHLLETIRGVQRFA
jgi:3-deoxy-D-arabino-heptulosonate 7-phosphate (DAHP) synthase